ncbi:hypothetical protein GCM10025879_18760 [Leuconostoc litchii]|uniref:Uncharacterized protein n=1 Tax=Leuconostoc litchii TaxID=1981069 RepID=A0A6P2CL18_9LACO|nr:hypothetical protein [Leuconostoc litchii]TYC46748.1 hypothetical protein ESZ47_01005 [Leuconostoc litchii]GMA70630.1 hypothetical protein GCM10025879_18760 [Leuconostoc litchii]
MLTNTLVALFIEGILLYSAKTFSLLVVKLRKSKINPRKVMNRVCQRNIYKWFFTIIILFSLEILAYVSVVRKGVFFKQSLERKIVQKVFQIFCIVQFVLLLMPVLI